MSKGIRILSHVSFFSINFLLLSLWSCLRCVHFYQTGEISYTRTPDVMVLNAMTAGILWVGCAFLSTTKHSRLPFSFSSLLLTGLIPLLVTFYADMIFLMLLLKNGVIEGSFSEKLMDYLSQEKLSFLVSLFFLISALSLKAWCEREKSFQVERLQRWLPFGMQGYLVLLPLSLSLPLPLMNTMSLMQTLHFSTLPLLPEWLLFFLNTGAISIGLGFILWGYKNRIALNITRFQLLKWITGASVISAMLFLNAILNTLIDVSVWNQRQQSGLDGFVFLLKTHSFTLFLPLLPLLLAFACSSLFKLRLKAKLFDETDKAAETSGYFGSAVFANPKEYEALNLYKEEGQIPIGMDEQKRIIFAPLKNKMTVAPPGGFKTSASTIPALLTYDGGVFVVDPKGEAWATTARHRQEVMGRNVVVIDPFGVTKGADFRKGKSESLLKEFHFNPFDWIPEDRKMRDRVLNNFASSFVINEGGSIKHFDDNAKILIRGYIDYMMTLPEEKRRLSELYKIMSESLEDAQVTLDRMGALEGRAKAAANQLARVGGDERGSILSTSYRQIDWMGDSNLQELLSESNFDLKEFLKGNMDIFVVLPEDQVAEHSRLIRMLMALLLGLISQTNPSDLPEKKMLFLLEELAQLGYCPDVEKCIEVLRARGVVVWSVFQSLSQIELFQKPDLFKGAAIKQIFTNDDTKTMEWIQTLGGKKTVVTKTISTNKGQSKQTMQAFQTSKSTGEGESVQETGVDLLPTNEIREMPEDEQWIFMHGVKPIRCKKALYFNHPYFAGRFDENPLEKKRAA